MCKCSIGLHHFFYKSGDCQNKWTKITSELSENEEEDEDL